MSDACSLDPFNKHTLLGYQILAKTTAAYPEHMAIPYLALGLAGEAGEVADKIKKVIRDKDGDIEHSVEDIARELGDVLWYVACLASELGYSLEHIADLNLEKLASRKARGAIGGSGDHR